MILEKIGKRRTYEFCIEGATSHGYPFAEMGIVVAVSFDDAVHAIRKQMAIRNEMRSNCGLSGTYTEITELMMVRKDNDGE